MFLILPLRTVIIALSVITIVIIMGGTFIAIIGMEYWIWGGIIGTILGIIFATKAEEPGDAITAIIGFGIIGTIIGFFIALIVGIIKALMFFAADGAQILS